MIKIHSVELINFRSVPYALIEPSLDGGITALAGGNGLGKSSVVHAILWACWGITPADVSVKGLRRQGSEGEECRVTVVLEHDGQNIEITRALKGRNDTTVAFIKVDGNEMTNVSAKTAVSWLETRLGGIDAAGFLTAFVVRQKELDDLVKARPAERKKIIERLAGIERMAEAVKNAREAENDAKKLAALLPGNPEDVEQAKIALADAEAVLADATKIAEETQTLVETLDNIYSDAAVKAADAKEKLDQHATLSARAGAYESVIAVAEQRRLNAETNLTQKTAQVGSATQEEYDTVQAEYNQIKDSIRLAKKSAEDYASLTATIATLTRSEETLTGEAKKAATRRDALKEKYDSLVEEALSHPTPTEEEISETAIALEKARGDLADAQAEYRRLAKAVEAIESTIHPVCPTCNRDMENTATILESLRASMETVTVSGKTAKENLETFTVAFDDLQARKQQAQKLANELNSLSREYEAAKTETDDKLESLERVGEEIAMANEAKENLENITAIPVAELETRAEKMWEQLTNLKNALAAAEELPALRNALETVNKEIAEASLSLKETLTQIDELEVDASVVGEIIAAAETAKNEYTAATIEQGKAENAVKIAASDVVARGKELSSEEAKIAAKQEAMESWQKRTATREALEAFRIDRLARIAPELAEVTTDLVARMTNGRYVAVDFDENFTPILTDDKGNQRPSSWLSGGEESVVALALRVGIGEIISGSRGGLLVLDEVLTAQDPDRRSAMMAAIREVPGRQVIMINHVAEALDIADRGYFFSVDDDGLPVVSKLEEGGTQIHLEHALDD